MQIEIALTDEEIVTCYPVMRELRPHVEQEHFLQRVRAQGNLWIPFSRVPP